MTELQVIELREKLENFQIQFDNYKIECKQLEQFLEQETLKKQEEIKILKQDAIKRQKQLTLAKNQVSNLQSDIKGLKSIIKQLREKPQEPISQPQAQPPPQPQPQQVDVEGLQKLKQELKESNIRVKLLEEEKFLIKTQKQNLQAQIQQSLTRHSQQILELKQQIIEKDHKIKQTLQQLQAQNQANREKKNRTVEIKIEKTKPAAIPQQYSFLKEMCKMKEGQLEAAKQKISKLIEKIQGYEKRIIEMENDRSQLEDRAKQEKSAKDQRRVYNLNRPQYSDEEDVSNPKLNLTKTSLSALFLTKSFYKSPFLDIEAKNVIKLFKADKNGRIDKSLGSTTYKLHNISFSHDQIVTKTLENIYEDTKNGIKSRIIIFGTKKSYKKTIMSQIISRLNNYIVNQISYETQSDGKNMGVRYVETQDDFNVKCEFQAEQKQEMIELISSIGILQKEKHESLKSSKRQKIESLYCEKKVRYFHYFFNDVSIQIITSSFTNSDIKQNLGLASALDKIVYSKIPRFEDQKCRIHVILTLNPILGFYEECKQTLKLVNCKKRILSTSNIYDWRQSPARKVLLTSPGNYDRVEQENQVDNDRAIKLTQKIDFYRSKLSELMLKLKIILSTHGQASYLKKSQSVLNYEKILKFVQTTLNQGYASSSSPRKQFKTVTLQQLQYSP